jgi:hypothetical protein
MIIVAAVATAMHFKNTGPNQNWQSTKSAPGMTKGEPRYPRPQPHPPAGPQSRRIIPAPVLPLSYPASCPVPSKSRPDDCQRLLPL